MSGTLLHFRCYAHVTRTGLFYLLRSRFIIVYNVSYVLDNTTKGRYRCYTVVKCNVIYVTDSTDM
jgi:hypothetical protein